MDKHEWTDPDNPDLVLRVADGRLEITEGAEELDVAPLLGVLTREILRLAEEVERLKESRAAIARATGEAFREGEAKASARIRRDLLLASVRCGTFGAPAAASPTEQRPNGGAFLAIPTAALDRICPEES